MSDAEDSMELDRSVLENCLRCHRDSPSLKLLTCSVVGCPIAMHAECMSSEPEIDGSGRFYCPYCAHKRALLRTERLRRKALRAREVLSRFIMSSKLSILEGDEEGGECDEEGRVRNGEKFEGIRSERERECVSERQECEDNAGIDKSPERMEGSGVDVVVPESGDFQGGSPLLRKKRYKKKAQRMQVQRVIPVRVVISRLRKSLSCEAEAVEEDGKERSEKETSKVSELDRNERGNDSSELRDIAGLSQNENAAASSALRSSPVTSSCFDLNKVPESDYNEEATNNLSSESTQSRDIPEPSRNEKATEVPSNSRERPDSNQNDKTTSSSEPIEVPSQNGKATEVLPQSRKVPDSNQNEETPSSTEPIKVPESGSEECLFKNVKRRKFNWTAEELKMLKEGVHLFSSQVNKNIPWRKILALGSHVFHKTRTPDNLKDKWKVLCREASNKQQT